LISFPRCTLVFYYFCCQPWLRQSPVRIKAKDQALEAGGNIDEGENPA